MTNPGDIDADAWREAGFAIRVAKSGKVWHMRSPRHTLVVFLDTQDADGRPMWKHVNQDKYFHAWPDAVLRWVGRSNG